MANESNLRKWKEKYVDIYRTEFESEVFVWRELTRAEFDKAKAVYSDEEEREQYVCRLCVLSPANYDFANCYAGIPTTLTRLILTESGFSGDRSQNLLDMYRMEMNDFECQIVPTICAAFPTLDPEDVEGWTIKKLLRYFSRAEWMLTTIHNSPIRITDGNDTEAEDYEAFPELRQEMRMQKKMNGR